MEHHVDVLKTMLKTTIFSFQYVIIIRNAKNNKRKVFAVAFSNSENVFLTLTKQSRSIVKGLMF